MILLHEFSIHINTLQSQANNIEYRNINQRNVHVFLNLFSITNKKLLGNLVKLESSVKFNVEILAFWSITF